MSKSTRYFVFSKQSATQKAVKNAATREEARNYKRRQSNPSIYGIFDRVTGQVVR